jgi:hypothetical protein
VSFGLSPRAGRPNRLRRREGVVARSTGHRAPLGVRDTDDAQPAAQTPGSLRLSVGPMTLQSTGQEGIEQCPDAQEESEVLLIEPKGHRQHWRPRRPNDCAAATPVARSNRSATCNQIRYRARGAGALSSIRAVRSRTPLARGHGQLRRRRIAEAIAFEARQVCLSRGRRGLPGRKRASVRQVAAPKPGIATSPFGSYGLVGCWLCHLAVRLSAPAPPERLLCCRCVNGHRVLPNGGHDFAG